MKNNMGNTSMLEEEKKFVEKIKDLPHEEQLPRLNSSNLSTTDEGSSLPSITTPSGHEITKANSNKKRV